MKVLLSWLNEFAPFGPDPAPVADALNHLGLAVDAMDVVGNPIEGVITAKVLRRAPHPQADRIGLVFVDVGDGEELQICCGAFNMSPGDVVPLATVGTTMPNGITISRAKMRGEWSNGMLCSARELQLSDDHGGILLLPGDTPLGVPVFDALAITSDVVFELDLTRNRPDCWGHLGIARDLAAHLGLPFVPPDVSVINDVGPSTGLSVTITDTEGCGRFTARRITGVQIADSPRWMADRLIRAGMRPINNVVDVSNFVMLELNRPNHAYDESKLGGDGFIVRCASHGEQMVTLDEVTRALTSADCLICDGKDVPIGIAGIMGGASIEVDANTTVIALEQAWFDPDRIAGSVARLQLRSEASTRFERGCDPFDDDYAARRFVQLLRETAPGAQLHEVVAATGVLPAQLGSQVEVRVERVNALLGVDLAVETIAELIAPIGYTSQISADSPGLLIVTIPTWRYDSTGEIDVIEEIARHHGYDSIARTVADTPHPGRLTERQVDRRRVRQILVGLSIDEAMPMPFLAPGDLDRAGLDPTGITITNPLVSEESVLRTSLLPGLLKVVAYNESRRSLSTRWFEIGHVFLVPPVGQLLPVELERLGVALAGRDATAAVAVLDELAVALDEKVALTAAELPGLHPTRSARVHSAAGVELGVVGEVDPDVLAAHGITERVAWLEIDLGALLAGERSGHPYRPVSKFPSNDVDLAFVLADRIPAADLEQALRAAGGANLVDLRLFDVYRGTGIAEGSRSLAYALRLQALDRTLTDADVAEVRTACIAAAEALGAVLRG